MKTKQIILALLLSAVPVFAQEGPNLVTNPGFEADVSQGVTVLPSGWNGPYFLTWENLNVLSYVHDYGHSGHNSFRFGGQQFHGVMTQTMPDLQPGTYVLRAWCIFTRSELAIPEGSASLIFEHNSGQIVRTQSIPSVPPGSSPEWVLIEMRDIVITAPGNSRIGFEVDAPKPTNFHSGGNLYVDDVEFVRVSAAPTPTPGVRSLTVKTKHMPGDQVTIKAPRKLNSFVFERWVGDTGAL